MNLIHTFCRYGLWKLSHQIRCVVIHAWVGYDLRICACRFLSNLDVGACIIEENAPIETFNISFESTQKRQYGTKITSTEERGGKSYGGHELVGLTFSPP